MAENAEAPIDRVVIVYNPKSTGNAPALAEQLQASLAEKASRLPVSLRETEHAGHAREIARAVADEGGSPLVVSVSGDGGFNEVVNGVLASANDQASAAVEAAGNANDHRRATERQPLAEAIADGASRRIDVLRLRLGSGEAEAVTYAHSYIGVGLTSKVARDLSNGEKGSIAEVLTLVRSLAELEPFAIRDEDGARREYDSLVFANISRMAKFASLSDSQEPDDGKFDVIAFPHASKWGLVAMGLKAATRGLGEQPSATEFSFTTLQPLAFQLDGEVREVDADARVRVEIARRALLTLG